MELLHVGILTESIDKSVAELGAFSANGKDYNVKEVYFSPENIVTGQGGHFLSTLIQYNGTILEWIQPLDPECYHAKELKKKGEGFHHLAFLCLNDQEEAVRHLEAAGSKIVWEAVLGEKHIIYMESADQKRVFELINYEPAMPS